MCECEQLPSVVLQQALVCESGTQPVNHEFMTLPLCQHATLVTTLLCYHSGSIFLATDLLVNYMILRL